VNSPAPRVSPMQSESDIVLRFCMRFSGSE
jgi:hypothetical protein